MKSNRNNRINNVKLTLLALVTLFSAEAMAADPSKPDSTSSEATVVNPTAPHSSGQDSSNTKDITGNPAVPDSTTPTHKKSPIYAKVGNTNITWMDYNYEYARQARKKFYHAKPAESVLATFQRQVGDTLITNAMLVQEAKRRKLKPDSDVVKQQLDQFERTFADDPKWPNSRPRVLPIITKRIQDQNLREQLEKLVRNVPPPSEKQIRKYYAAHPEKFTTPQQPRVSVILLRVDPGAPDADWQKASEQGQDLVKRLRAGEDFAELARQYSGDKTAEDGGDMGYMHEGMLPGLPAETVGKLQPGETSDPVNLMEGVAIFRLVDRMPPTLTSFNASKNRARDLLLAEQSDNAWNSLIAKLKKSTPVTADESNFVPLSAAAEKPDDTAEKTKQP